MREKEKQHPDEARPQEATQGDWAAGDMEGGTSLSVGDDHLEGPEQLDHTQGGPLLDTSGLETVFEDLEFPCERAGVMEVLEERGDDHPITGVDLPEVIAALPRDRFMNMAELVAEVRGELDRRAHLA